MFYLKEGLFLFLSNFLFVTICLTDLIIVAIDRVIQNRLVFLETMDC